MKSIIFCFSILCASNCIGQTSKIHGVVTYYFNEYQGDKPDIGAKVYVIDSAKCKFDKDVAFKYDLASISHKAGESDFDSADIHNATNNSLVMQSESAITTTVDGAGNYSLDVKPGTYYIMIQSRGRNRTSVSEVLGKVYYTIERTSAGQTSDVSHRFPM